MSDGSSELKYVRAPGYLEQPFRRAEELIENYFSDLRREPSKGKITVGSRDRYTLCYSASLAFHLQQEYRERFGHAARYLLYRFGFTMGREDCHRITSELCKDEEAGVRFALGPVFFAFCGMGNVEFLPQSNPAPDDSLLLVYKHHNSFEAEAYLERNALSDEPVCLINCGYSAGWCSSSFGLELSAEELTCKVRGDDECIFVMAPSRLLVERISELTRSDGLLAHLL